MQESDRAEYLKAHGLLVRRVRRIAVFVALLFIFAVNLGFENIDRVKRQAAAREAYLLSLATGSPLLEGIPKDPFDSKDVRRLHRAIEIYLEEKRPRSLYGVFGLQLPFEAYVLLLLFGSTAALAALWVTLGQLRRLHTALAPEAIDGSGLQRALNSLFFERVTLRYGERWARHLMLGLLPIGVLATATVPLLLGGGLVRLDRTLHPQPDGTVWGQPDPESVPVVLDSSRLKGGGDLAMVGIVIADMGLALAALATGATMIKKREEH
jgi:hypothetical protein